jgi:hypothetical protein
LPLQDRPHTVPHHLMVVGDEQANSCQATLPCSGTRTRTVVPASVNEISKVPPS